MPRCVLSPGECDGCLECIQDFSYEDKLYYEQQEDMEDNNGDTYL